MSDGATATGVLTVERERVVRVLFLLTALLVVVGTAAALVLRRDVPFAVESLGRLFLLDEEATVASWWASALLLAASGGLVLASGAVPALRWRLRVLAVLLVALSVDESAIVHERATGALLLLSTGSSEGDQPLWIVVALPLVALTGWFVIPILRALPPRVRTSWWLAAGLYVGGAVGVELVVNTLTTRDTSVYQLGVAVEEGMEYAGPIVLLDSLLLLATGGRSLELRWPRTASSS